MKDIKEITEQLEKGVKEVFNSDRYKNYLDTMSKFYQYSANNVMLILMQKPDASLIASYKSWQKDFKRNVKKGEHAIRILAPITHKYTKEVELQDGTKEEREGSWLSYMGVPVFDISQTEGESLPSLVTRLTGDVEQFNTLLANLIAVSPVQVEYEDIQSAALGYFNSAENRIAIKEGMAQEQTIKTLVHEIAHAMLHNDNGEESETDHDTKEVQAESVAYTVCKALGINTDEYSFGYIAGWSKGKEVKELTASMEVIRKTAKTIIDAIHGKEVV